MKVFYGPSIAGLKPYMKAILERGFEQTLEDGGMLQSEILVEEIGDQMQYIYLKDWKYSFLVSSEPFHHDPKPYTMVFCGNNGQVGEQKDKCVLFPMYYFITNLGKTLEDLKPWSGPVPEKFACAFVSNPLNQFRNRFLHVLRSMGLLDSFGLIENTNGGERFEGDMIAKQKEYKFCISFENSEHEQYITEKILAPLNAGIVPVYWGCPNIDKHFNPERFLWVKGSSDEDIVASVHTMIAISKNERLWQTIVAQPVVAPGGSPITLKTMGDDVNRYLKEHGLLEPTK